MDVIFVGVDFKQFDFWMASMKGLHDDDHIASHTGLPEYFSSILGGKD